MKAERTYDHPLKSTYKLITQSRSCRTNRRNKQNRESMPSVKEIASND